MPSLFTIDTLSRLLTTHILHPFPFLLLSLSLAALGYPSTTFQATPFTLQLPTAVPACAIVFFILYALRILARLDASLASNGNSRNLEWEDEVVLVTGGLGGLGGLLAEMYAMRGVPVAVVDVQSLGAEQVSEMSEKGIQYWRCDVGDRKQVEEMAESVRKELGAPTILINNAAVVSGKSFLKLSHADVERTFRTNLLSHYNMNHAFLPAMLLRPNGGTIVTVSSVLGYLGCAGLSAYTSSKAALTSMHQSLTAELRLMSQNPRTASLDGEVVYPSSISTLLVTPGQLSTPLFAAVKPPALSAFLGPTVEVAQLAAAIAKRVDAGEGGELSMPMYARWIGALALLPAGVGRMVRGWAGLDRAGWEAFCVEKAG